jgi:C4-dicarboxylate transporter, DcuC family
LEYTGLIISLLFIAAVSRLLLQKYHPQAVLLVAGMLMILVSGIFGQALPELGKPTGFAGFDLFALLKESFAGTNASVGLMIMVIGGFVAYIDKIGASEVLVRIALKPLGLLKKQPHLAAIAVIPIGQILFVCVPSAAGLGLLLMASVFPILTSLGVSRIAAVSVITACTGFGIGPASAISASATSIANTPVVPYFIDYQIPLAILLNLTLMISYYFVNRHYDKKETKITPTSEPASEGSNAPSIYALIPILPLILLIVFSGIFSFLPSHIHLDTTTAMLVSLFVAVFLEYLRFRNFKEVLSSFRVFWSGMGDIFKTVVTLIIAADIFAKGLISLGFIDHLISISQSIGFGAVGIAITMTCMIFLASMLMGSGNAAFFAFGPLIPNIASKFGVSSTSILLPMNFAASMGRTVSPVAGVLIATAEIAKVTPLEIVKRNFIPFILAFITLLIYHFAICY